MRSLNDFITKLLGNEADANSAQNAGPSRIHFSKGKSKQGAGPVALKDAVSYAHIKREFGDGFLFSSEQMQVGEREITSFTSGSRENIKEKYYGANVAIFESAQFKKIVRLSLSVPTFDSGDREYDSWHDLFLLQEHDGIIRAVYCTGGYRIAHIEGYAQVYQYPESLKKYF